MKYILAFIRRLLGRKYYEYVIFIRGNDRINQWNGSVYIRRKYKIDSTEDYKDLLNYVKKTNDDIKNLVITNIILLNNLI